MCGSVCGGVFDSMSRSSFLVYLPTQWNPQATEGEGGV